MKTYIWVSVSTGFLAGAGIPWGYSFLTAVPAPVIKPSPVIQTVALRPHDSERSAMKEYLASEWRLCLILGLPLPTDGETATKVRILAAKDPGKFLRLLSEMNGIPPWEKEFKTAVSELNLPSAEGKAVLDGIRNPALRDAILVSALETAADDADYTRAAGILDLNDDGKNRELTEKLCGILVKGDAEAVVAALSAKPGYNPALPVFLHELTKQNITEAARIVAKLPLDWQIGLPARLNYLDTALEEHPGLVTLDQAADSLKTSAGPRLFWLSSAVSSAVGNDPAGTVDWIAARPNGVERNELLKSVAKEVGAKAPERLEQVMAGATSRSVQNAIAWDGAGALVATKGLSAGYDWAAGFSDPALRETAQTQFVRSGWEKNSNEMVALTVEAAAKTPGGNYWQAMFKALGLPSGTPIDSSKPPAQLKGLSADNLAILAAVSQKTVNN